MIKLLTEDRINEFSAFCQEKTTGAVILTRFYTYGLTGDTALFWFGEDKNGSVKGVFSLLDGVFLACCNEDDREEAEIFAKTMGASQISYGEAEFTLKFVSYDKKYTAEDISGENIKDVFDVVFEDDPDRQKYFAGWYTDASHKIRHSLIHGKCIYKDGKCVSVALTSGETAKIAVISSVATLREYRKQGLGKQVVLALAQSLDKDVYLMTDSEKTKIWYEKMGFVKQ